MVRPPDGRETVGAQTPRPTAPTANGPLRSPAIGSLTPPTESNGAPDGGATGSRPEALLERWTDAARVQKYRAMQGWIDGGERLALLSVADEVRGRPVLDLGVGAGRTSWLLRLLTDDYVGLDWSPEMAEACRAAFPALDVRQGDARNLNGFPDAHFALVLFSYNGIDNLDHDGRHQAMAEAARVLAPGGYFIYSTMSKTGPAYLAAPALMVRRRRGEPPLRYAVRAAFHLASNGRTHRRRSAKWRESLSRAADHGSWATAPLAALDDELVHFSTVEAERQAIRRLGLEVVLILADDGRALESDDDRCSWFHLVTRKP